LKHGKSTIFPLRIAALLFTATAAGHVLAQETIGDCFIEPNRVAEISSAVDGVVEKISVQRGDAVKRGQALVTLESHVEKATVELARARAEQDQAIRARTARVEFTRRLLERNRELYSQNLISEQVVDEAETEAVLAELELGEILEEKAIAELELDRARQALALRTIRSPFSGVVIDVLVAPGESIENRSLVKLASIDPLNVEVIVPVGLFGKIDKGMKATVIPEAPIGGEYTARVVIVDRVLDAASGTFGIRLQLSNKNYRLPAGLRCTVKLEIPEPAATEKKTETNGNDDAGYGDESGVATISEGRSAVSPEPAGDDASAYIYTVYLFSTRSEEVANQVNERFQDQGHPTEILISENDGSVRYRIGVTGFESLQSANGYSASIVGTLGVSKTWIGKDSR
jgi:RND family efflux transporter MFP subunit